MIPQGIDDKYEIIQVLKESAATAVLLVNYKQIGALRILKAIHKASPDADSILSESHLLQGIRSSHIPTIYNVEETNEMIYLVEEYIEGMSLREYCLKTKLTKEQLLDIAIKICEIIEVMHTAGSDAVLYRDMKPEHVIMTENDIKLIDFGISVKKSMVKGSKPLGTKGWAAPEQLNGDSLDERCDIYAVGKVIGFMQKNSYAKDDFKIKQIVDLATKENAKDRLKSICELKRLLENLRGKRVYEKLGIERLEKQIAVVGATHGVGTTHIAIALCSYFNKRNMDCYYEASEGNVVQSLWRNLKNAKLSKGVLYHDSFRGILNVGETIEQNNPPKGLKVVDCGITEKPPLQADIVLFVASGAPWQQEDYPEWIKDDSVCVINNFSDRLSSILLAKELRKKVYMYPTVKGNIEASKDEEKIFSAIFKNEKDFVVAKK